MKLNDKVIIITGASSGIGRELALQLSKRGNSLVLAARRKDLLDQLAAEIKSAGGDALAVQTDVSNREQVKSLVTAAIESYGRLDVMINNAGVSLAQGVLMDHREEEVRKTMDINFMGCVYGAWAAIPVLEKSGGGLLVFVSSIVGKRGIPRNSAYCASKFAVNGLAESIRPEVKKKNIRVVTICPPGVDTPFFEVNGKGDKRNYPLHPVKKIARRMIQAMEGEKRESVLTLDAWLLKWLSILAPRFVDWGAAKSKKV